MGPEAFISRPELDSPLAKQFCCCMECDLDKDCQVPNIASIRHTCEHGMRIDGPVDMFHSCAHMLEHGIVLFLCGSSNTPWLILDWCEKALKGLKVTITKVALPRLLRVQMLRVCEAMCII